MSNDAGCKKFDVKIQNFNQTFVAMIYRYVIIVFVFDNTFLKYIP